MLAIDVKDLKKKYASGTEALKGVTVAIEEGDFFGLLGANGAGKTTLIGILCGLVNSTGGSGKVFGFDINTQRDYAKQQIGIVPQEFNFSIFEKVWDILITQAGYYGLSAKETAPHAEELLKKLGLWEKRDQPARALSGGMKRRLMIARALVHKPRLLILDEPTAGVDVELRYGMWEYLTELNKNGTTILLTTHYLEEAEKLCKNLAIINKGEIVKTGSVAQLLQGMDVRTYVLTLDSMKGLEKVAGFSVKATGDSTAEVTLQKDQEVTELIEALKQQGICVSDLNPQENRLERLFLETIRT
ncbi:MAG: ABC transporter ATP-binding protein [Patescibacteria group bacterium]